jgi:hypothetical protein
VIRVHRCGIGWLEHPAKYLNHFTLPETEGFNAQSDQMMSLVFGGML